MSLLDSCESQLRSFALRTLPVFKFAAKMPAPQRKSLLASRRRRRQDEGEEEESVLGDFEDDSLSEGSAVSNGDDEAEFEGSESSGDEREPAVNTMATAKSTSPQKQQASSVSPVNDEATVNGNGFRPSAEMEAMRNGLTQAHHSPNTEQLQFDDLPASNDAANAPAEDALAKAPRNENPAQRARREHQEYIRQRNANPAFVPTRGGFFLHDDRNSHSTAPNPRPFGRGRGRNHGPPNNNHNRYAGKPVWEIHVLTNTVDHPLSTSLQTSPGHTTFMMSMRVRPNRNRLKPSLAQFSPKHQKA